MERTSEKKKNGLGNKINCAHDKIIKNTLGELSSERSLKVIYKQQVQAKFFRGWKHQETDAYKVSRCLQPLWNVKHKMFIWLLYLISTIYFDKVRRVNSFPFFHNSLLGCMHFVKPQTTLFMPCQHQSVANWWIFLNRFSFYTRKPSFPVKIMAVNFTLITVYM